MVVCKNNEKWKSNVTKLNKIYYLGSVNFIYHSRFKYPKTLKYLEFLIAICWMCVQIHFCKYYIYSSSNYGMPFGISY